MVILRTGAEPWGTQGKASGWGGLGRFPRIDLINIKAVAEKKKRNGNARGNKQREKNKTHRSMVVASRAVFFSSQRQTVQRRKWQLHRRIALLEKSVPETDSPCWANFFFVMREVA